MPIGYLTTVEKMEKISQCKTLQALNLVRTYISICINNVYMFMHANVYRLSNEKQQKKHKKVKISTKSGRKIYSELGYFRIIRF